MPKKTKPPETERPKPTLTYPSAPTDPAARLAYMRRRNASIAKVDPDEYMAAIAMQDERVRKHGAEPRPEKRP